MGFDVGDLLENLFGGTVPTAAQPVTLSEPIPQPVDRKRLDGVGGLHRPAPALSKVRRIGIVGKHGGRLAVYAMRPAHGGLAAIGAGGKSPGEKNGLPE